MIYEYPCHDVSRFCLRVEKLSKQIIALRKIATPMAMHMAIEHQVELIQLLDRPDIRTKLSKLFQVFLSRYQDFLSHESVDRRQVRDIIDQIKEHMAFLQKRARSSLQEIHQSSLTSMLLQNISSPGRLSDFSVPFLKVLKQHINTQNQPMWLNDWFGLISPFIRLSELMLELLRLDTYEYDLITEAGQCHLELKSSEEVFLIQILIDDDLIFPTIIYGKHRLSVHFQEMSQRMEQTNAFVVKRQITTRVKLSKI